jgi:tRNA modification GTPase
LVDTAGIRATADVVEIEGVVRARQAMDNAELAIVVLDGSRALEPDDRALVTVTANRPRVVAVNKADLVPAWSAESIGGVDAVRVSARTGGGLDELAATIVSTLGASGHERDAVLVTNVRHISLLERARDALDHASASIVAGGEPISEEFLLADLQEASAHLQEITGRRTADDLLQHIFKNFCIGK